MNPMKFCYSMSFIFPKQPQNLDPSYKTDLDMSYKMDLDFWIVLEGKKLHLITTEIQYWHRRKNLNHFTGCSIFMCGDLLIVVSRKLVQNQLFDEI